MLAWVIDAGCSISVSTPPSETASVATRTWSIGRRPAFVPPFSSKLIIEPKPVIWRLASSRCGWDSNPTTTLHTAPPRYVVENPKLR